MKDNNKNNYESNNLSKAKGIAVGMVIGAAAVALKDKKNQEYVKKSIKKVKEWAEKTSAQVKKKTDNAVDDLETNLDQVKEEIGNLKSENVN